MKNFVVYRMYNVSNFGFDGHYQLIISKLRDGFFLINVVVYQGSIKE